MPCSGVARTSYSNIVSPGAGLKSPHTLRPPLRPESPEAPTPWPPWPTSPPRSPCAGPSATPPWGAPAAAPAPKDPLGVAPGLVEKGLGGLGPLRPVLAIAHSNLSSKGFKRKESGLEDVDPAVQQGSRRGQLATWIYDEWMKLG